MPRAFHELRRRDISGKWGGKIQEGFLKEVRLELDLEGWAAVSRVVQGMFSLVQQVKGRVMGAMGCEARRAEQGWTEGWDVTHQ